MLDNVPDLVIGAVFFITLLVAAVFAGNLLQRSAARRNRRALASLASLMDASPQSDHKSGWLHGQYQGKEVRFTIIPGKNIGQSSETARHINACELVFGGIEGDSSWQISREGLLRKQWVVSSPDERLRGNLAGTDLISRLSAMGNETHLRYDPAGKALSLHQDVKPRLAPKPDQFRAQLDFMVSVERINAKVNRPPAS